MTASTSFGISQTGSVRADNQDAIRLCEPEDDQTLRDNGLLYAVADGMGGYEHGGIASALALETFFSACYGGSKAPQNMRQGMQAANLAVFQTSERMQARMGTTLSAANIIGSQLHIAHIGDSRIYLVRNHKAVCLTNDHTPVGQLVRMRVISPDKVRTHERRSVLEKCLGMQLFVQPDISRHDLNVDDYLILCTDGVWAYVEDDEFAQIIRQIHEPERISQALIDRALERSSDDNVSAIVIHAAQLAPTVNETTRTSFTQFLRGRLRGKTS